MITEVEPTIREESELLRSFYLDQHNLKNPLTCHMLLRLRNVIIILHSTFYTQEAFWRILDKPNEVFNNVVALKV